MSKQSTIPGALPPGKPVAQGVVCTDDDKPFRTRVVEAFITDNPSMLFQNIITRTIIPGLKTLFVQGVAAFVLSGQSDRARMIGNAVFGSFGSGYSGYPYNFTNPYPTAQPYTNPYMTPGGYYNYNTMVPPTSVAGGSPMGAWTGAISFPTREAAESCFQELSAYIGQYNRCSLVTVYEVAKLPNRESVSAKWGYTDLSGCTIAQDPTTHLWVLRFPSAVMIN